MTDTTTAGAVPRQDAASALPTFVFQLYVAGNSPQSTRAVERAKAFCEAHIKGAYQLKVIDLYQQPELAEQAQIVAAPTLVKSLPLPLRQLIGDLSNTSRLLLALDIDHASD